MGLAFYTGRPLAQCIGDAKTTDDIVVLLGRWCVALGISNAPSADEFLAITQFIFKHFSFLTYKELMLAMELCVLDELDFENKHYNSFSIQYVSRVLKAYQSHRAAQLKAIDQQTERLRLEQESRPATATENAEAMRLIVRNEYEQYQRSGEVFDFFDLIWDYLKATNKLALSTEQRTEAITYAERKLADMDNPRSPKEKARKLGELLAEDIKHRGVAEAKKKYARMFCLRLFFKTINIEQFLSGITEQEFTQQGAVKPVPAAPATPTTNQPTKSTKLQKQLN